VVSVSIRETEEDVTSFTSSGDEKSAFVADTGTPLTSKTQSGRKYLKQYSELTVNSPRPAEKTIEQSMKPFVKK